MFRIATPSDTKRIANLHALSWQENYRESFSAHFLDDEVFNERLIVWQERLKNPKENQQVLLAEDNGLFVGFICSYFEEDSEHGTYLDNLHVSTAAKGKGIGTQLMAKLAQELQARKSIAGFYLWVLTTNHSAITFYENLGGKALETVEANDIGDTVFQRTRYVWRDMEGFLKLVESKSRD